MFFPAQSTVVARRSGSAGQIFSMRFLVAFHLFLVLTLPSFAQESFAALERHALSASAKDEKTLDSLAKYLRQGRTRTFYDKRVKFWTRNWSGDEATAREIYIWVGRRIRYLDNDRRQLEPSDKAAQMVLDTRFGVCHDYAVLYNALASKAGLDAEYIWGTVRVRPSPEIHAWNAVCIAGEWRMIDSCWGGNMNPPKIDYKWFLLEPEKFTESHLPWESEFRNYPCCSYLQQMSKKKLLAIRHKMGTKSPDYEDVWEW